MAATSVGIEVAGEQVLLDHLDAAAVARRLVAAELAAVAVGERDVVHVGQQRAEAGVLARLARGERHARRWCGRETRPGRR